MNAAAILPSRDEPTTITAVTTAVDTALATAGTVIVNADSSSSPTTCDRFAATPTRTAKLPLSGLPRGKGAQVLTAARHAKMRGADAVLIVDTDTLNPDPAVYSALLDRVRAGAALAIADYPRFWDEANLTSHLARPLIAATTGHDMPQPLAGDLALSGDALSVILQAADGLPTGLKACVNGYGIDAFLLLTAAGIGPIVSVRVDSPKAHAASFPHLPAVYRQAVPALLHLTAACTPPPLPLETASYRVADRPVPSDRLTAMLATLKDHLGPDSGGYDGQPWPVPVLTAWHAVRSGAPAPRAARRLWPHYLRRVHDWLANGHRAAPAQRGRDLAAAHARLHTAVLTHAGARR
ncbi:hypothetical protein ACWDQO_04310 [Streptomyces sp. NPDC003703]|uniref:hypothetical protein n=1 Tax=Streptomyces sp. NPDC003283 TaxID=3364681 RepID=UPI0036C55721